MVTTPDSRDRIDAAKPRHLGLDDGTATAQPVKDGHRVTRIDVTSRTGPLQRADLIPFRFDYAVN